jgi:hypothetical protein
MPLGRTPSGRRLTGGASIPLRPVPASIPAAQKLPPPLRNDDLRAIIHEVTQDSEQRKAYLSAFESEQITADLLFETLEARGPDAVQTLIDAACDGPLGHRARIANLVIELAYQIMAADEAADAVDEAANHGGGEGGGGRWWCGVWLCGDSDYHSCIPRSRADLCARICGMLIPTHLDEADEARQMLNETMTISALLAGFATGISLSISNDEIEEYAKFTQRAFFGKRSTLCTHLVAERYDGRPPYYENDYLRKLVPDWRVAWLPWDITAKAIQGAPPWDHAEPHAH